MKPTNAIDEFWRRHPGVIRRFIELQSRYEKLAEEVAYILEKSVQTEGIEYSAVTHRTKTLDSFCEKALRKSYNKPLDAITDVAGVRIVYLYTSERAMLESVVENEFVVVEKVDKIDKDDTEHFGYGALHYLVKLGRGSTGARYDDLKDLVCEIQVRTILQDAWAVVSHHLSYKKESDVPPQLRRKLNALSGLFETADDQFDRLKVERTHYAERMKEEISSRSEASLRRDLNLDNLMEFLNWRLPNRGEMSRDDAADLLSELRDLGCKTLADVEEPLSRAEAAVKQYESRYPPIDLSTEEEGPYSPVGAVRVAFQFVNPKFAKRYGADERHLSEFRHLVKPKGKVR